MIQWSSGSVDQDPSICYSWGQERWMVPGARGPSEEEEEEEEKSIESGQ